MISPKWGASLWKYYFRLKDRETWSTSWYQLSPGCHEWVNLINRKTASYRQIVLWLSPAEKPLYFICSSRGLIAFAQRSPSCSWIIDSCGHMVCIFTKRFVIFFEPKLPDQELLYNDWFFVAGALQQMETDALRLVSCTVKTLGYVCFSLSSWHWKIMGKVGALSASNCWPMFMGSSKISSSWSITAISQSSSTSLS